MKVYQHFLIGLLGLFTLLSSTAYAQNQTSRPAPDAPDLVEQLFELAPQNSSITKSYVSKATFLQLDKGKLKKLSLERPDELRLEIPQADGKTLRVDLFRENLFADEFYADNQDGNVHPYERGAYYHGYLANNPKSLAAVSIFEDKVYGIFAVNGEKIVLGHLKQDRFPASSEYILYNTQDMTIKNTSKCAADDLPAVDDSIPPSFGNKIHNDCKVVNIYFEADYRMYLDNGSDESEVLDFTTAMFNVVKLLYKNDGVIVKLSKIRVWTTQDSYPTTSSTSALYAFRSRLGGSFDGDIAQLLSTVPNNNGGVAFVGVLCTPSYAVSYSNIRNSFSQFPTYSWTVEVVTHELGHNLGSPHTHSCSWPGGAIDGCYASEGACPRGPAPNGGGTIMSYCHLTQFGIDFNKGFGQKPGDLIRSKVNSASCLNANPDECNDDGDDGGDNGGGGDDNGGGGGGFGMPNLTKLSDNMNSSGLNVNAAVLVTNKGEGRSTPCQISFYLSVDNSFSSSDYLVASKAIPLLNVGENYGVEIQTDLGQADVPVGNYYLGYIIDSGEEVEESNESDNTWYWINPRFPLTGNDGGGGDDGDDGDGDGDGDDGGDVDKYCKSGGEDVKYEWIARVAVGDIDNETERDNGYGDYTELSTDLERGSTPSIRLAPGFRRQQYREQWMVWIDFNGDKDFDDSGELVFQSEQPTREGLTGRLTIPGDVEQGARRMRVSMKWYDEDDEIQKPCSSFGYGEVEDYTVNIVGDAVASCEINNVTPADQSECDPRETTYYQEIRIAYSGSPEKIMATIGEITYEFEAERSPQHIKIENLPADGNPVDVELMIMSEDGCEVSEVFERLFTAPEACELICEVPTPLGVDINNGDVSIEWEENEFAEYYQIRYREAGAIEWIYETSREMMYKVGDLVENSTYEYQIRANCGEIGWSDWSEIYVFVTPGKCGIPAPRSVQILGSTEVRVNWYPLPRSREYRIRWREYDTEEWMEQDVNSIFATLSGLTGGTTYEYQLSAKCGVTWAGWSAIYVFVTTGGLPPTDGLGNGQPALHESQVSVYPNPANDWISLIVNQEGTQLVKIMDATGRMVKQNVIYGNENQIEISDLKSGIYFLQVTGEAGNTVTKRIVKY
ncbi:MAG: M12 family metallo-peptidase [Bacteroidota bacterium]